jgi:hypothetical protein
LCAKSYLVPRAYACRDWLHNTMASPLVVPSMMDDHFIISRARNHLADALKALLNANIMDEEDFSRSRKSALAAVDELDVLLRESDGHPKKS